MARRADPLRIEAARRAAAIARLVSAGYSPVGAADLVAEWQADQGVSGRPLDRTSWEGFDRWLAGRRPMT